MTSTFEVADMTCGRCAASITRAVQALDPTAQVAVDLARKRVCVDSARLAAEAIGPAIALAGYTPRAVAAEAPALATAGGGCCCGGGRGGGGGCH